MSDPLIKPLEEFARRTSEGIGKKAVKAVKDVVQKMEHGTKEVASNAVEAEEKHAAELDALGRGRRGLDGDTPVYMVDDEGKVHRLNADGTGREVGRGQENSGIDGLMDANGRIAPSSRKAHPLGREKGGVPGPRVGSAKVAAGGPGLPEATLRARTYTKDGSGKNYAAVHYDDNGHSFVLVGHSEGPHSETVVGVPFLRQGMAGGVRSLYTERAPCHVASHYCGEWLHKYFKGASVSHSFEYGPGRASQAAGNRGLRTFLKGVGL